MDSETLAQYYARLNQEYAEQDNIAESLSATTEAEVNLDQSPDGPAEALFFKTSLEAGVPEDRIENMIYERRVDRGYLEAENIITRRLKALSSKLYTGMEVRRAAELETEWAYGEDRSEEQAREIAVHQKNIQDEQSNLNTAGGTYGTSSIFNSTIGAATQQLPGLLGGLRNAPEALFDVTTVAGGALGEIAATGSVNDQTRQDARSALISVVNTVPMAAEMVMESRDLYRSEGLNPDDYMEEITAAVVVNTALENFSAFTAVAAGVAAATGVGAPVAPAISGVGQLVKSMGRSLLNRIGRGIVTYSAGAGKGFAAEAATGGSQYAVNKYMALFTKNMNSGMYLTDAAENALQGLTTPETIGAISDAAVEEGLGGLGFFFLGGTGGHAYRVLSEHTRAERNTKALKSVMDSVAKNYGESQSAEVGARAKQHGVERVRVPAKDFAAAVSKTDSEADVLEVAIKAGATEQQAREALDTGGDIEFDPGQFINNVGRSNLAESVVGSVLVNDQSKTVEQLKSQVDTLKSSIKKGQDGLVLINEINNDLAALRESDSGIAESVESIVDIVEKAKANPAAARLVQSFLSEEIQSLNAEQRKAVKDIIVSAQEPPHRPDQSLSTGIAQRIQNEEALTEYGNILSALSDENASALSIPNPRITGIRVGMQRGIESTGIARAVASSVAEVMSNALGYMADNYIDGNVDPEQLGRWWGMSFTAPDTMSGYLGGAAPANGGGGLLGLNMGRLVGLPINVKDAPPGTLVSDWVNKGSPGVASVLSHEILHSFMNMLIELDSQGFLNETGRADLKKLSDAMGDVGGYRKIAQLKRRFRQETDIETKAELEIEINNARVSVGKLEERLTTGLQHYLNDGVPPSPELAGTFWRLRQYGRQLAKYLMKRPGSTRIVSFPGEPAGAQLGTREDPGVDTKVSDADRESMAAMAEVFNRWFAPTGQEIGQTIDSMIAEELSSPDNTPFVSFAFAEFVEAGGEVSEKTLKDLGMTKAQIKRYASIIIREKESASRTLSDSMSKQILQARTKEWSGIRRNKMPEATALVAKDRRYRALSILQTGKDVNGNVPDSAPDGLGNNFKMDHKQAVELFGEDEVNRLNSLGNNITHRTNGIDIAIVASELGFDTPEAMRNEMAGVMSIRSAINETATALTVESHGPPVTQELVQSEVDRSLQNDKKAERLQFEIEWLSSQEFATFKGLASKIRLRPMSSQQSRFDAQAAVLKEDPAALTRVKLQRYLDQERRLAKASGDAFLAGDYQLAADLRQQQLHAYELYRVRAAAKDDLAKAKAFFKRSRRKANQARLGKGGEGIQETVNVLAHRLGHRDAIRPQDLKGARKLADRLAEMAKDIGADVELGPTIELIKSGTQGPLNYGQVHSAYRVVKMLNKVANDSIKQAKESKKETLEETVEELTVSIDSKFKGDAESGFRLPSEQTPLAKIVRGLDTLMAEHMKMEFLFRHLDGDEFNGPVYKAFFGPMVDAQGRESVMMEGAMKRIQDSLSQYTKQERRQMGKRTIALKSMNGRKISKWDAIMMAANWGNAGNRAALIGGQMNFTEENIQEAIGALNEKDAKFLQDTFDHIGSYWDEASEVHRRVTGETPTRVGPMPFEVAGIKVSGGYFPIVIDRSQDTTIGMSIFGKQEDGPAVLSELAKASPTTAMTRHGHLKERENANGKPLNLSPNVITNHVAAVVHDITHREAVINAWNLSKNKDLAQSIRDAVGGKAYTMIEKWLVGMARADQTHHTDIYDWAFNKMRQRTTAAMLAFNHGTMVSQTSGYAMALREIGPGDMAIGMKMVFSEGMDVRKAYAIAKEKSRFMHDRLSQGYEREMRKIYLDHQFELERIASAGDMTVEMGLELIGLAQMTVDLPTWFGAYQKRLNETGSESEAVAYADHVVRMTQGDSSLLSLSNVQRRKGIFSMFTMFYTFFSVQINAIMFDVKGVTQRSSGPVVKNMIRGLTMVVVTSIMEDLVRGRFAEDEDDDDSHVVQIAKQALKTTALIPTQGIVGVRDVVAGVSQQIEYGRAFGKVPILSAIDAATYGIVEAGRDIIEGTEMTKKTERDLAIGLGALTKAPGLEVYKVIELLRGE